MKRPSAGIATVGGALLALAVIVFFAVRAFRTDSPDAKIEIRRTCEPVKAAVRTIYRIEKASADSPRFVPIDVEGLTAAELRRKFLSFRNAVNAHLWMPGMKSWLVVEHEGTNHVQLVDAMEAVARDPNSTVSFSEVFASYAGTIADVMTAFDAKLEGEVVPEWFVPRELPHIAWLDPAGLDEDILAKLLEEMQKFQNVRRLILEGNIASRSVGDKETATAATDKWAEAKKLSPNDSMLLERLEILERNGQGFFEVGRYLQAMKCYETIVLVDPQRISAVHNFGLCLKKIGRADMAEKVLRHAEEMAK